MAIVVDDSVKLSGRVGDVTYYQKGDKTIARKAHNKNNKRNQKRKRQKMSRGQFIQRARMSHNDTLWRVLRQTGEVFFEGGFSPCHRFRSVNKEVPNVFLTKDMHEFNTALLLPGMMISDGPVPSITYQLGEVIGQAALLTDLTEEEAQKGRLLLYVLRQDEHKEMFQGYPLGGCPTVSARQIEVNPTAESQAEEGLAVSFVKGEMVLTGEMFSNDMAGFGLVHVIDGHASTQRLVTRCTYYEKFTTEEALLTAAASYGKLIGE